VLGTKINTLDLGTITDIPLSIAENMTKKNEGKKERKNYSESTCYVVV